MSQWRYERHNCRVPPTPYGLPSGLLGRFFPSKVPHHASGCCRFPIKKHGRGDSRGPARSRYACRFRQRRRRELRFDLDRRRLQQGRFPQQAKSRPPAYLPPPISSRTRPGNKTLAMFAAKADRAILPLLRQLIADLGPDMEIQQLRLFHLLRLSSRISDAAAN